MPWCAMEVVRENSYNNNNVKNSFNICDRTFFNAPKSNFILHYPGPNVNARLFQFTGEKKTFAAKWRFLSMK